MSHINLADQVMKLLLDGEDEVLCILREQYKNADIVSEEDNGVGFYINYYIDKTSHEPPALLVVCCWPYWASVTFPA